MAKTKQPTDENTVLQAKTPTSAVPVPEPTPEPEAPTPKKVQKPEPTPTPEPDDLVLDVLRSFAGYETLYVDRHGGAFSADTPPAIRAGAVLYRNPFYKS